jgi:D-3-phosphoglycerate dehydrogenase / 2-oxoglutarate reductase
MKKIVNTIDFNDVPEATKILTDHWNLVSVPPIRELVFSEMSTAIAYISSASLRVDKDFFDASPLLKVIASPSTGKDHIDMKLLESRDIVLLDISKEFELLDEFTATSELAFTLLLALVRNLLPAVENANNGIWSREQLSGTQLYGKTFGILGLGRLGKISAKIANGFGMKVIAHDTTNSEAANVNNVSLSKLLSTSDVLSVHIHLNEKNIGFLGKNEFKQMKPNLILLNTSRGKIIEETALLEALQKKMIAGAGLDVVDGEWLSKKDLIQHPLISYARENRNLIIVPHIGGSTYESITGARAFIAKKLSKYLSDNV